MWFPPDMVELSPDSTHTGKPGVDIKRVSQNIFTISKPLYKNFMSLEVRIFYHSSQDPGFLRNNCSSFARIDFVGGKILFKIDVERQNWKGEIDSSYRRADAVFQTAPLKQQR